MLQLTVARLKEKCILSDQRFGCGLQIPCKITHWFGSAQCLECMMNDEGNMSLDNFVAYH